MSRLLFVTLVDTSDPNNTGVNQKIAAQRAALCGLGYEVDFLHFDALALCLNDVVLHRFRSRATRWLDWSRVALRHLASRHYSISYLRHSLTSPAVLGFTAALRHQGARVLLEIPTFPYDREFRTLSPFSVLFAFVLLDRLLRRSLRGRVNAVLTFSPQRTIWGIPALGIRNGVDLDRFPVRAPRTPDSNTLVLISVSTLAYWHGVDRLIRGMGNYARQRGPVQVELVVVGRGAEEERLRALAREEGVAARVRFTGLLTGRDLDQQFETADLAVGSLGRHRSGIQVIQTLKNREYCARGVPFFYSESDPDFDEQPFALRVPPNEQPIDVDALIRFQRGVAEAPEAMRAFASSRFGWSVILAEVLKSEVQVL